MPYKIIKFTDKTWDGDEMAEQRNGAPIYGLFEIYHNEDGTVQRNSVPYLYWDSYLEEEINPFIVFNRMLKDMQISIALQSLGLNVLPEVFSDVQ